MSARLLDVNVLVALFDAAHPNHEAAHRWLARVGRAGWSSCALTENGLVRVLSHPKYPSVRATAGEVARRLAAFRSAARHVFWPCDVSLTDTARFLLDRTHGPAQLTDVYLLGLAVRHRGVLATFDAKILVDAVVDGDRAIEVIPP